MRSLEKPMGTNTPYSVRSLFHWHPDRDAGLSRLIVRLKGKDRWPSRAKAQAWKAWANEWMAANSAFSLPRFFLAAPGGHHAALFAKAFSELTLIPWHNCLVKRTKGESKKMNRVERSMRRDVFLECAVDHSRDHIILIDDIYTTGSTAQQCYDALGKPKKFEVWTFAYRHLKSAPKDVTTEVKSERTGG